MHAGDPLVEHAAHRLLSGFDVVGAGDDDGQSGDRWHVALLLSGGDRVFDRVGPMNDHGPHRSIGGLEVGLKRADRTIVTDRTSSRGRCGAGVRAGCVSRVNVVNEIDVRLAGALPGVSAGVLSRCL